MRDRGPGYLLRFSWSPAARIYREIWFYLTPEWIFPPFSF